MVRKDLGYSLARLRELLIHLLSSEAQGKALSYTDLADKMKTDFKTVQRYVKALEEVGWVEVVPEERRNLVKLTERGRCVAKCFMP